MEIHLLNFALVIGAALGGGAIAKRIGYPAILGELIAGIVLGPAAIGFLSVDEALSVVATVGVLVMMLYVGMHLDLGDLRRSSLPALLAAVGGFIVPAGAGYWLATTFGMSARSALFVALAMGITSLATKSRVLVDLRLLDTRVAHVMMAGALIADLVALVGFAALLGAGDSGQLGGGGLALVIVKAVLFVVAAVTVGLRLFPIGAAFLARRGSIDRGSLFLVVVMVALVYGAAAEAAGLHGILGTFFAGLMLRPGLFEPRLYRDVEQLVFRLSVGFLAPVFFVTAGFHVDLGVVRTDFPLLIGVILVATVGKIVGTALFYLPSGRGWREGLTVGVGMNGRGAVEIIAAELALERGLIDQTTFSVLVLMALITTASVPFLLTRAVNWLRSRGELVRSAGRSGAIVVGAGPVARAVAAMLSPNGKVTLVDTNLDHCRDARKAGLQAIHGNALDASILRQSGASDALRIVCMTSNPSVNVLVGQRAATEFGIPHVSVLLTGDDAQSLRDSLDRELMRPFADGHLDLELWNRRLTSGTVHIAPLEARPPGSPPALGDPGVVDCVPLAVRRRGDVVPLCEINELEEDDEIVGLVPGEPAGTGIVVPDEGTTPIAAAGAGS